MPVRNDDEIWLETEGEIELADPALVIGYAIYAEDGNLLYWSYSTDQTEPEWPAFTPGRQRLRTKIPPHLLNEGSYRIELVGSLYYRQWLFASWMDAPRVHLTVQGGLSDSPYWTAKRPGLLAPLLRWEQMEPQATAICAGRTQTEP
jgi:lipopolysaccharide transport system ATP-binding protein